MGSNQAGSVRMVKGGVTAARGFKAGAVKGGIKKSKGLDTALLLSDKPCTAAGSFTTNAVRASSVDWCESHLPSDKIRSVICVSGNANACTGEQGIRDNADMAREVAKACGVSANSVLVATTGVIGHFMPMDKVRAAVPLAARTLGEGMARGAIFARSIMTTDLRMKEAAVRVNTPAGTYAVAAAPRDRA
jgi:glutamate N-acetyltransferase / amino-acid N-acetyltransferase